MPLARLAVPHGGATCTQMTRLHSIIRSTKDQVLALRRSSWTTWAKERCLLQVHSIGILYPGGC